MGPETPLLEPLDDSSRPLLERPRATSADQTTGWTREVGFWVLGLRFRV